VCVRLLDCNPYRRADGSGCGRSKHSGANCEPVANAEAGTDCDYCDAAADADDDAAAAADDGDTDPRENTLAESYTVAAFKRVNGFEAFASYFEHL
jgi:hypothetical protein